MSKIPLPGLPDYVKIIKCPDKYKEYRGVLLRIDIIQHPALCLEGIGYYGMLEAGAIKWEDIPNDIKEDLLNAGYVQEVSNEG